MKLFIHVLVYKVLFICFLSANNGLEHLCSQPDRSILWGWKFDAWHKAAAWREPCYLPEGVPAPGSCSEDGRLEHLGDQRDDVWWGVKGDEGGGQYWSTWELRVPVPQMSRMACAERVERALTQDKSLHKTSMSVSLISGNMGNNKYGLISLL